MDPIAKILGDAYATVDRKDNTMNRLITQMLNVRGLFLFSYKKSIFFKKTKNMTARHKII